MRHKKEFILMQYQASPQNQQPPLGNNGPLYIQSDNKPEGLDRWLAWWYKWTAPPTAPVGASFEQREIVRRGRLGSTIMFFLGSILLFLVSPIGIFGPNHQILITAGGILALIAICIPINRTGHVNAVGLIVSIAVNAGIYFSILRTPGGIGPADIGIFDLLVFSEVFVASLLPIVWVIPDAIMNILFCYLVLMYWQKTPQLIAVMQGGGLFAVISRPIQIHFVVSGILYLWVWSANKAIRRADQAEEVAKLQHDIASQQTAIVAEKRLLDTDIQAILQTHVEASNGHLNARVTLQDGAALWPIAGSLNNLLSRMQRLQGLEQQLQQLAPRLQRTNQIEYELQRIQNATLGLSDALHRSMTSDQPIQATNTDTILDTLVSELNGKQLVQSITPKNRISVNRLRPTQDNA
jgi:hypothetical protein